MPRKDICSGKPRRRYSYKGPKHPGQVGQGRGLLELSRAVFGVRRGSAAARAKVDSQQAAEVRIVPTPPPPTGLPGRLPGCPPCLHCLLQSVFPGLEITEVTCGPGTIILIPEMLLPQTPLGLFWETRV